MDVSPCRLSFRCTRRQQKLLVWEGLAYFIMYLSFLFFVLHDAHYEQWRLGWNWPSTLVCHRTMSGIAFAEMVQNGELWSSGDVSGGFWHACMLKVAYFLSRCIFRCPDCILCCSHHPKVRAEASVWQGSRSKRLNGDRVHLTSKCGNRCFVTGVAAQLGRLQGTSRGQLKSKPFLFTALPVFASGN